MVIVCIPPQLRPLAKGQESIKVGANDLQAAFSALDQVVPLLRSQLFNDRGNVRDFVAIFVDGFRVRFVNETILLGEESEIVIMLAIAGG